MSAPRTGLRTRRRERAWAAGLLLLAVGCSSRPAPTTSSDAGAARPPAIDAPRAPRWATFRWTAGLRFREHSVGPGGEAIVRPIVEHAQTVELAVAERAHEVVFPVDRAGDPDGAAAQLELPLTERLHMCLRVYGLATFDSPESVTLIGWVFGNWTLAVPSARKRIDTSLPGGSLTVGAPAREESLGTVFFGDAGGHQNEYQAFSTLALVSVTATPPPGVTVLDSFSPQGTLSDCASPAVELKGP
jgi:hypothetical protein